MKIQLLAFFLLSLGITAFANEVVVPSQCGLNEVKKVGAQVFTVCEVTVATKPVTKQEQVHLTAVIGTGTSVQTYFYEFYIPSQGSQGKCSGAVGAICIRHFKLAGTIVGKNQLQKNVMIALPKDEIVIITRGSANSQSIAGQFMGLNFSSSKLKAVFTSQSY